MKIWMILISNTTLVFEILAENTIKAVSVPNLRLLILVEILCSEKFEGADVKYHITGAFSSSSPKIPK